jgi:hypothetical protein
MKFLFLTTCFLFISISLFAQTIAEATPTQETMPVEATAIKVTDAMVDEHNKIAFTQIGLHLQAHLNYPTEMTELALEGTVTAAVVISAKGEVARISIAKADLPKAFHLEVVSTLLALEKLDMNGKKYLGETILYVPVHFSL